MELSVSDLGQHGGEGVIVVARAAGAGGAYRAAGEAQHAGAAHLARPQIQLEDAAIAERLLVGGADAE
jgi:hypothetical protein